MLEVEERIGEEIVILRMHQHRVDLRGRWWVLESVGKERFGGGRLGVIGWVDLFEVKLS